MTDSGKKQNSELRNVLNTFSSQMNRIHKLSEFDLVASMRPEEDKATATTPSHSVPTAAVQKVFAKPFVSTKAIHSTNGHAGSLPVGERTILAATIQFPNGLRRDQLTVLAGYKRSTRDAYIQRLRERGFVEQSGELIVATDDGCAALPDAEPLPTGQALQDYWLARLPEGERVLLGLLIEQHPKYCDRDWLSEHSEFKRSTRDAYLQRLNAKQLVVSDGRGVKASEQLF